MLTTRERAVREQKMHGHGPTELTAAGRGPAVVALHGFGGTAAELLPTARALADAGYAVDAPVLPGHGTRVEDLQGQRFHDWLDFARARAQAAVDAHGRVVLLGFSMGSLLAMDLATERPLWLAGLVVMGNALTVRPHTSVPFAFWDWTGRPVPDLYFTKPLPGDVVDTTLLDTLVTYDRHPLQAAMEVYRAGRRIQGLVERIEAPTLILHGRRDRVCHWNNAPWLAQRIGARDTNVRIFERSAHVLACDGERDEVAAEVLRFVRRLA